MAERRGLNEVPVQGVWLRSIGGFAEVLVEIDRKWYLCIREEVTGAFSHICEPEGIIKSPVDGYAHWQQVRP